jgi:hypothetical protein
MVHLDAAQCRLSLRCNGQEQAIPPSGRWPTVPSMLPTCTNSHCPLSALGGWRRYCPPIGIPEREPGVWVHIGRHVGVLECGSCMDPDFLTSRRMSCCHGTDRALGFRGSDTFSSGFDDALLMSGTNDRSSTSHGLLQG